MGLFGFFKKKKDEKVSQEERRRIPRWPVRVETTVSWQGQQPVECVLENLNLKGFSITMPVMFQQSLIKVQFHLAPDFLLNLDAMVLWYRTAGGKHRYGILITRMRNDDRERLYEFVRANFPDVMEKRLKGE
jgi:hypothetical protein